MGLPALDPSKRDLEIVEDGIKADARSHPTSPPPHNKTNVIGCRRWPRAHPGLRWWHQRPLGRPCPAAGAPSLDRTRRPESCSGGRTRTAEVLLSSYTEQPRCNLSSNSKATRPQSDTERHGTPPPLLGRLPLRATSCGMVARIGLHHHHVSGGRHHDGLL